MKMIDIYEVWRWHEKKKPLAEYMNKILREKMETSGWPSNWVTEKDVNEVKRKEGIELDAAKIKMGNNPVRKSVAKLMLY